MSLAIDVTHRFGSFLLEARFVSEGRLTAFFGRSGSGKTSLINIIAGVVRPNRGRIVLDDYYRHRWVENLFLAHRDGTASDESVLDRLEGGLAGFNPTSSD